MEYEPIWHPAPRAELPYLYLRRRFNLAEGATGPDGHGAPELRLRFACAGSCELYLNGRRIGRGLGAELAPDPVWYAPGGDLSLRDGENVLLVLARAGGDADAPWFALDGQVSGSGVGEQNLGSGALWEVLPARSWETLDAAPVDEIHLAGQQPTDWVRGRFAPDEWQDAAPAQGPAPRDWSPRQAREEELYAREVTAFGEVEARAALSFASDPQPMRASKCVHREALLQPGRGHALVQARSPDRAVYLVLDFGRAVTGFPCLRLHAGSEGLVDLGFARAWGTLDSGVRYACRPGPQEWVSTRMYTGRYLVVRLSQCAEPVEVDCVSFVERRFAVDDRGAVGGTPTLERVWDTGRSTLASGRQEIYWPLGAGASYDWLRAYTLALDDYYLTGDAQTAAATLAAQPPPTAIAPDLVPGLAWVLFLEALHAHTDCGGQVADLLPAALQVLAVCRESCGGTGLLPPVPEEIPGAAATALYGGALAAAQRLCSGVGEAEPAARCGEELSDVRRALQALWSPSHGLFRDQPPDTGGGARTPTSVFPNALLVYFGLAAPEQEKEVAERLGKRVGRGTDDLMVSFFVAGALWRAGAGARALAWVEQRWAALLDRPGLTWGEKAASPGPAATLGTVTPRPPQPVPELLPGPDYFLGSEILGVSPGAPGYSVLHVRPQPSGLERASGSISTPRGPVQVDWRAEEDRFTFRVDLAEPGETHLFAPRLGQPYPTATLNGELVWRNEKVHPNPFVQEVISAAHHVVLVARGTGPYEVVVTS